MLIVALATAGAAFLLGRMDHWIKRIEIGRDKTQGRQLALAGIDFARAVLSTDARSSAADSLDEDWARRLPPLRQDDMELAGQIEDAQGRLNLNDLRRDDGSIDESALEAYRRLLSSLGLSPDLADPLADWLDADDSPRAAGAEANTYLAAGLPGGAPGRPLDHLANLHRIRGYTPEVIDRLHAFVSVLPGHPGINLNTAPPEVLAAIQPGLDTGLARTLAASRQAVPFRDVSDYRRRAGNDALPSPSLPVSVASRHFIVRVEVSGERTRSVAESLVQRYGDGSKTRLLWLSLQ